MPGVGKVKNAVSPQAMKEVAEASKQALEAKQTNDKKTAADGKAEKNDKVEISDKATKLSKNRRANMAEKAGRSGREGRDGRDGRAGKSHSAKHGHKVEKASKKASASGKVNNRDHKLGAKRGGRNDASILKAKTEKLSMAFKGLSKMGVSAKDVSKVIKAANRNMNEKLGKELKQAYSDYKDKKISADEFKSKLYGTAIKKVQGIASALRGAYSDRMGSAGNNNVSTQARQSIFESAKKEDAPVTLKPQKSIFDKTDSVKSSPTPLEKAQAKKDEPTLAEKAIAANKEKSEEAKAAAEKEEKTKMAAKPAIEAEPKITEKTVVKAKDDEDDDDDDDKKKVATANEKAVPPGLEKKEEGTLPPGLEKKDDALDKLEKELRKMLKDIVKQTEKVAQGLEKKDEFPGKAEKAFEEIVGMFNDIDRMVNGLDKDEDGADENEDIGKFADGLKGMLDDMGSAKSNSFLRNLNKDSDGNGASDAHKEGMEQIHAEKLSSLFKGGNTGSAYGINRVGDSGEGSGNFSAVDFMSDMSNNVGEGLDSFKDAKEAREAATANEAKQAGVEGDLSTLA